MKKNNKISIITFTGALVILAAFLWVPIYLAGPDGLERVLFNLTDNEEYEPETNFDYDGAPFPDYEFNSVENGYIHTWLIGLIGSLIVATLMFGLLKIITIKKNKPIKTDNSHIEM